MDAEVLRKKLNGCIEVENSTFERNGLHVERCTVSSIDEDDGWLNLNIEVSFAPGVTELVNDLYIKANFYDEDDTLLYSDHARLGMEKFQGYDTMVIETCEDKLAFNTTKCKVYAVID